MSNILKLNLSGVDCPNCAQGVIDEIKKVPGVSDARLNFPAGKIYVTSDAGAQSDGLLERINAAANRAEKGAALSLKQEEGEADYRREIARLFIGLLLFVAGLFIKDNLFSTAIFVLAYLVVGIRVIKNVVKGLFSFKPKDIFDENFLMSIASIGALILGEYMEAVAVMLFYEIGELMGDYMVDKSRRSLKSLLSMKESLCHVKVGDVFEDRLPEEVKIGEAIAVKKGEMVPLDGELLVSGVFSMAALTGESRPVDLNPGDEVLAGYINEGDAALMVVKRDHENSSITRMMDLIEESGANKAKSEKFITAFARIYTPAVLATAVALCFIPPIFYGFSTFHTWFYRALVFLTVSCPCALVLSVPLAYFAAIGGGSKNGIIIKGGLSLEALSKSKWVAFDKTGTVTDGSFSLLGIVPKEGISEEEIIKALVDAEQMSNHPISRAVLREFASVAPDSGYAFEERAGRGVIAKKGGETIVCGSYELLKELSIDAQKPDELKSSILVAKNGEYLGRAIFGDKIKESAKAAIKELKSRGIKVALLSGDSEGPVKSVARELDIDDVHFALMPKDKVDIMKEASEKYGGAIFVGDGINDAPVIMGSDVGIAMGAKGSDVAAESADVIISDDDLKKVVKAIAIAQKTRRIVIVNIAFSLAVKFAALTLGAIGAAGMLEAIFADVGVMIIAIFNSMRAMKTK